jgi:hypothetical protein
MKNLVLCTAVAGLLLSSVAAEAKGCIKGAIIGGIAGHYAGHGKVGRSAHNNSRSHRTRVAASDSDDAASAASIC